MPSSDRAIAQAWRELTAPKRPNEFVTAVGVNFLNKLAAELDAQQKPADGGQREWLPDEGAYLVKFDDAEREDVLFASTGAKAAALAYYEKVSMSWNAHLFVKIDSNSRDCTTPSAVPPTTDDPALRSQALDEFTDYFVRNYPGPNTIIADPHWHAPRLFRAAERALTRLAAGRPVVDDSMKLRALYAMKAHADALRRGVPSLEMIEAALSAALNGKGES